MLALFEFKVVHVRIQLTRHNDNAKTFYTFNKIQFFIFYEIRFMDRLKSIHWESVTITEEMQNESEIREEIRAEYTRR